MEASVQRPGCTAIAADHALEQLNQQVYVSFYLSTHVSGFFVDEQLSSYQGPSCFICWLYLQFSVRSLVLLVFCQHDANLLRIQSLPEWTRHQDSDIFQVQKGHPWKLVQDPSPHHDCLCSTFPWPAVGGVAFKFPSMGYLILSYLVCKGVGPLPLWFLLVLDACHIKSMPVLQHVYHDIHPSEQALCSSSRSLQSLLLLVGLALCPPKGPIFWSRNCEDPPGRKNTYVFVWHIYIYIHTCPRSDY